MSDLLERIREFERPQRIEELSREKFSQPEVVEALDVAEAHIIDAVSRFKIFLLSDSCQSKPRQYYFLDVYALLVYLSFDKYFPRSARKTLVSQVSHLLFGDMMKPAEAEARSAELTRERERGPLAKAKSDKFLYRLHQQRREEIRKDVFAASPLWWSRDPDRNFVLFGKENHTIVPGLFDRRDNGGKIPLDQLEKMGIGSWVNATQWFSRLDEKLEGIVVRRRRGKA